MNKKEEYIHLLHLNYEEAVSYLLEKYGPASDDYFRENSYKKFMNGVIKSITKGKTSRTSEGLYCHHIEENKYLKMADFNFIKNQNIPYSAQTKDRLVYCDLIEHAMLHAIIARETDHMYGKPGLDAYLMPLIEEWYILERKPFVKWQLNCYEKAYVSPSEANELLDILRTSIY